jgi:gamma-glutamyltranspeptidase/glutathione hydrolase
LKPAIDLAENGFQITELQRRLQKRELANFKKGNAAPLFLRGGDKPYTVGRLFKQPVLAKTLERLAEAGIEDFYTGAIGERICEDMAQNGGFIQKDDMANIPWPIEREAGFIPVRQSVHSYHAPSRGRPDFTSNVKYIAEVPETTT